MVSSSVGQEAVRSCEAIVRAIHQGLAKADVAVVQLLTTREQTMALLQLDQYGSDYSQGSNSFVRFVQDNTRIPVLGHAEGICHLYG